MPDAGASQGNNAHDLTHTMPQPNPNPIIQPDGSVAGTTMPPKTQMTFQEALLMGQKFSKPLGISLENPVVNPWEALANNQVFQEVHTAYRNLEEQAQRYMGSPTPLSRQEIEFGVYWAKGPFGAYYKYKNGFMMLESHQKFLVLQSRFAEGAEKIGKNLEALKIIDTQNNVLPEQAKVVELSINYNTGDLEESAAQNTVASVEKANVSNESGKAGSKNTEFNSDAIYWSYDLSPIPPSEVGGKIEMSKSTVDGLKAAGSVALDASGEFALDRGGKGEKITLPGGKVITSETLKTYGEATKGIGVLLDAKDAKEYGEQVFQEAKNRGLSDEDAESIAHRAVFNYLGWFKLPERGGQALLAASHIPYGGYIGIGAGEVLERNFQDDLKDYFMNRAIKEYMTDKENWRNFKAPDPSAYYNRTR